MLPLFTTYQFNRKILILKYPTPLAQEILFIRFSFCVPLVGDCWSNGTPKGCSLTLPISFVVPHGTFESSFKRLYIPLFLYLSNNLKSCFKVRGVEGTWAATYARAARAAGCALGPYTIFLEEFSRGLIAYKLSYS